GDRRGGDGLVLAFLPDFRDGSGLQQQLAGGQVGIPYALGVLGVRLGLTLLACWAEVPGGLFFPSLVFGAAIGSVVSRLEESWLGLGHPATYALAGMGAFFGAVAKVPMTAIAMVFELTTNFNLVLPLMVSATTAYLVADKLAPGSLYEHLLRLSGIDLPTSPQDGLWLQLTAEDVMQSKVEVLESGLTLAETVQAFGRSHHRGFPVVQDGALVGIVTQTDLEQAQQRRESPDTLLVRVMTANPIAVAPQDTLARVLYLLSHYKLSRLPVLDRRHLVGIITRSDILRAEVERLHVENTPARLGSYLVYQRRSPAVGRGTVLVPVANPDTIPALSALAAAAAQRWGFEVEFCHAVVVGPRDRPAETVVNVEPAIELLDRARLEVLALGVPAHCQVRLAQNAADGIADAARDSHANLLLMGWRSQRDAVFGQTIEGLVQHSRCDLVLVKFAEGEALPLQRWLIPVAGGPNARRALELLPYLSAASPTIAVTVCQVFRPGEPNNPEAVAQDVTRLQEVLSQRSGCTVTAIALCATDVVATFWSWPTPTAAMPWCWGPAAKAFCQSWCRATFPRRSPGKRNARCFWSVRRFEGATAGWTGSGGGRQRYSP
ncbi:MAG: CBS domain-containing protein, partial [Oscillatoriales cyanobacterium SM2_1_8]|nr:CBS domain-containing protein [Oscillatoriales cyanobacterium SM2_1_8]